ncbi:MAG TPA: hypothetical protein VFW94_20435 [Candidatus Acidoferrales bacterium]|nr:hypothetical protein [Candidatus Acidoferrales bacterium]
MKKKMKWTIGVALVGGLLSTKGAYWLPGTYAADAANVALAMIPGGLIGFLIGCVVEKTTDTRKRKLKILYWTLALVVFGSCLAFGRGVPIKQTLTVLTCTIGFGLAVGLFQYFWDSRDASPRELG